jgi:hypothetical protein
MRTTRYTFLFVIGLLLTLGISTAFAADNKRPKGTGILTVRTSPDSMPVKVDGQFVGMSGVSTAAEFFLLPGFHTVEVTAPDGKVWRDEIEIRRDHRNCVCLKFVSETISTPCPYRFNLEGPEKVMEGDLITFTAMNAGTAPIPIRYDWKVSGGRITSGLGTPSITVDTGGFGGQTITADLDVNDDTYDNRCRQVLSVPTEVGRIPPPPTPYQCVDFPATTHDADKARFDNCVIQVQNTPDAQLYVIIYPGTDRRSRTANTYERTSKMLLDYMVKTRGLDPRRIQIVKGPERISTTYVLWVVPPGATPPVP